MNDPIGDLLIRIKNGYMARQKQVVVPHSNVKVALTRLLQKLGYVGKVVRDDKSPNFTVELLYIQGKPALTQVKRVSKPGLRKYVQNRNLRALRQSLGHVILTTPKGLRTHIEAKKEGLGGEVLCTVW